MYRSGVKMANKCNKHGSQILFASVLLTLAGANLATSPGKDWVDVPWQTTSYKAILPAPFHSVSVTLISEDGAAQVMSVEVNGKILKLDEFLSDLSAVEIESLTYSRPTMTKSGSIEYFEVLAIFGEAYRVRFKPCDDIRNFNWEKDIAVFRVDTNLIVTRRVMSFRSEDQCGT